MTTRDTTSSSLGDPSSQLSPSQSSLSSLLSSGETTTGTGTGAAVARAASTANNTNTATTIHRAEVRDTSREPSTTRDRP